MPRDDATCWFGIAAAKQKMDVEAAHPTAAKTA